MSQRIWELHSRLNGGGIATTPEGDADVGGLVLSEKAYLHAVHDFRPKQLIELVEREGPTLAAERLVAHYADPACVNAAGGRSLVAVKGLSPPLIVRRSDERAPVPSGLTTVR